MSRLQPEAYLIFTASVFAQPRPNEYQKFKKKKLIYFLPRVCFNRDKKLTLLPRFWSNRGIWPFKKK